MSEIRMWAEDPVSSACSVVDLPEVARMEARSAVVFSHAHSVVDKPMELPVALLGVPFSPVTFEQTVARIEEMIGSRRPHYVVTANVDFLVQARNDVELHRVLFEADLVLCDGQPLAWASRWLGAPLPERVAGSDLVPELIRLSAEKGYRIFFLGGTPHVAAQAVAKISARYPGVNICGYYSPPFASLLEMDHEEIADKIKAAKPDLLFVSLGCPKAEKWMFMHYRALGVPVAIGVGGTIDFLAERLKRAPVWMRGCGLEWLFRLVQEPGRLYSRYARDAREFGWAIAQQLWYLGWRRDFARPPFVASIELEERTWLRIRPPNVFTGETLRRDFPVWSPAVAGNHHCLVDLAQVRFMDSAALGLLLDLRRRLARRDLCLVFLQPSAPVRAAFRALRVEHLFLFARDIFEARELIENCIHRRHITASSAHATLPLIWTGEIIAANAADHWSVIQAQIDSFNHGLQSIPVDLSALTFIDSTGVGMLVRARKYAASRGKTLEYLNAPQAVRNVLRIARLESLLLSPVAGSSDSVQDGSPLAAHGRAPFPSLSPGKTCLEKTA